MALVGESFIGLCIEYTDDWEKALVASIQNYVQQPMYSPSKMATIAKNMDFTMWSMVVYY